MPDRVSAISDDRLGKGDFNKRKRNGERHAITKHSSPYCPFLYVSSNTMSNPLMLKCEIQISKLKDEKD